MKKLKTMKKKIGSKIKSRDSKQKAKTKSLKPSVGRAKKKDVKKVKIVLVKTEAKFLRISSRKLRLVAGAVKQFSPQKAIDQLSVWNKKGARLLLKVIQTAVADAENNFGLKKESLRLKNILVNEGPSLKRQDRSHGARFKSGIRKKKSSHLRVIIVGAKES